MDSIVEFDVLAQRFPNLEEFDIQSPSSPYVTDFFPSDGDDHLSAFDSIGKLARLKTVTLPWPTNIGTGCISPEKLREIVTRWKNDEAKGLENVYFYGSKHSVLSASSRTVSLGFTFEVADEVEELMPKMNPSGYEGLEGGSSANHHGGASSSGRPKLEHLQSHFSHIAPHLKAHLTDRQANPILSTSEPASGYLAPLSEAFVNAYETGSRMGLGMPVRVTLSTTESSLVVLQSAPTSTTPPSSSSGTPELAGTTGGIVGGAGSVADQKARQTTPVSPLLAAEGGPDTSKMLVSTVIAPAGELAEARVAIWAIEDVARRLQTSLEK
ncbi:hypothetical protein TWF481_005315 [Arthrobotrys musiformis]|uniref:Uncharacterized protein n=1 Tax=Arthrobotrys musiformis TaxID=47236 RepID=A0AAV9WE52_9PEZI